jgi:hypothetical protein
MRLLRVLPKVRTSISEVIKTVGYKEKRDNQMHASYIAEMT